MTRETGVLIGSGPRSHRRGPIYIAHASPWAHSAAGEALELDPLRTQYAQYLSDMKQEVTRPLFHMLHRWKALVPEGLVLDQIANGHQIPFKDGIIPPCTGIVKTRPHTGAESRAIDSELENLPSKGAVTWVPPQD